MAEESSENSSVSYSGLLDSGEDLGNSMATFLASSWAALPFLFMDSSDMQALVSAGTVRPPSASIAAPFLMTSLFHSAEV